MRHQNRTKFNIKLNNPILFKDLIASLWCSVEDNTLHCYNTISTEQLDYTQALAQCEADGGYLAQISSRDEFDFIAERLLHGKPTKMVVLCCTLLMCNMYNANLYNFPVQNQ